MRGEFQRVGGPRGEFNNQAEKQEKERGYNACNPGIPPGMVVIEGIG